jgi:hypothetical protein
MRFRSLTDDELTAQLTDSFAGWMTCQGEAETAHAHLALSRLLLEAHRRGWVRSAPPG